MKVTKNTRKVQRKKTEYMSDEAFADLKEAFGVPSLLSVESAAS